MIKRFCTAFTVLLAVLYLISCENDISGSRNSFVDYNFNFGYTLYQIPSGTKPENMALALKLPVTEGKDTLLNISEMFVFVNGDCVFVNKDFSTTIAYNAWINDKGYEESNYQAIIHCLPQNFSGQLKERDEVRINIKCKASRQIQNTLEGWLIDNSPNVNYYKDIGSRLTYYNYNFDKDYIITKKPVGNDYRKMALVCQMPDSETGDTILDISVFTVKINGKVVFERRNFTDGFRETYWEHDNGDSGTLYQMFLYCLPEDFTEQINENDIVSISINGRASHPVNLEYKDYLIDNSPAANYWMEIGSTYFVTKYDYTFNKEYSISSVPTGKAPENMALVLQLPPEEGEETQIKITELQVLLNGKTILYRTDYRTKISYNSWTNSEGNPDSNYQVVLHLLPENFGTNIKLKDKVKVQMKFSASRQIQNEIKYYLIDNSSAVGYWNQIGSEPQVYNYNFAYDYRITASPYGTNPDNLAIALQLPSSEGNPIPMEISSLKLYVNDTLINNRQSFTETLRYNTWTDSNGFNQNYQTEINCYPENYNIPLKKNDKIRIELSFKTEIKIKNEFTVYVIDHCKEAGYWNEIAIPAGQWVDPQSFNHSYATQIDYRLKIAPSGNKPMNLMVNMEQYPEEGEITNIYIESIKIYINNKLVNQISDSITKTTQNFFMKNDGKWGINFAFYFSLIPDNFNGTVNKFDAVHMEIKLRTDRKINSPFFAKIFDSSPEVNGYKELSGELPCNYEPQPLPLETINYKGTTYKLKFYDDFDRDFSALNPKKYGVYNQPQDRNNWYLSDFGSNEGSDGEHRCARDFKIQNGAAEFPVVHVPYQYKIQDGSTVYTYRNDAPTLMTCDWDTYGQHSVPLFEFNKGIYEIRFKAPQGSHPGQFTFWVLNYNTNFEAGAIPTNPYRASDGYALDEIDFFEYSPSMNIIRTGSRSCNSYNHRPAAGYTHHVLPSDFGGKWHIFRCVWDEKGLTSYLDGELLHYQNDSKYDFTVPASAMKGFNNPKDKFMLLISSQAIRESGIDGNIDGDFEPYSYFVDYIKVYEKQ